MILYGVIVFVIAMGVLSFIVAPFLVNKDGV